jgi:hypothetical protein
VCPGWLAVQPAVIEGCQALAARKDGCLEAYYPGLENTVLEAADVAGRAYNLRELDQIEAMRRKG